MSLISHQPNKWQIMSEFTHAFTLILIGYYPAELAWRLLKHDFNWFTWLLLLQALAKRSGLISPYLCGLSVNWLFLSWYLAMGYTREHRLSPSQWSCFNILMSYRRFQLEQ